MESLSLESKTIYKLLMADSKEEYERRFLDNKKEVLNALQPFIIYTKAQLNSVNVVFVDIKASVGADLEEARSQIGGELDSVHKSLHAEITQLVVEIGRLPRPDPGALVGNGSTLVHREPGASSAGLIGHSCDHNDRVHCVFTTRFLRSEVRTPVVTLILLCSSLQIHLVVLTRDIPRVLSCHNLKGPIRNCANAAMRIFSKDGTLYLPFGYHKRRTSLWEL